MAAVETERAIWDTAYVNNLPDSAFLHVESGGTKDSSGKTVPRSLRHFPVKDAGGAVDLPHLRNALARIPQSSLPDAVKQTLTSKAQKMLADANQSNSLPKDGLVRAIFPADLELRETASDGMPTLTGHFAVFDQWTEINSVFEGRFLERIAPGAFAKTFRENASGMRVLFNHGSDPSIGNKILGAPSVIEEDDQGARYEVPLLDTSYNRDLLPGLRAGGYGASFRFKVVRENFDTDPERSAWNPGQLPERTITEAQVMEFGPVTFPAYDGATAGVRSLTDEYLRGQVGADERAAALPIGMSAFPPGVGACSLGGNAGYSGGGACHVHDGSEKSMAAAMTAATIDAQRSQEPAARMDAEDLATLAEMIKLGTCYIEDQDEPDDQKNIPAMEEALKILASLVPVEVAETEPVEPEDEEASSVTATDVETRETEPTTTEAPTTAAAPPHPTDASRRGTQNTDRRSETQIESERKKMSDSIEEMRERQATIRLELQDIAVEFSGQVLDESARAKWEILKNENDDLDVRIRETSEREQYLRSLVDTPGAVESGTAPATRTGGVYVTKRDGRDKLPENVFDMPSYHGYARDTQQLFDLYRDGARKAVESFDYPHEQAKPEENSGWIEKLINRNDGPNREFSRRVLACGSPLYRRAYWKSISNQPLNAEEQRAMSQAEMETRTEAMGLTTGGGIAPVPIQLDPTVILTSNGVLNPIRRISSVETTTSYWWQGVTSGGVVAQYQAEAATMINNAGTMVSPVIQPERVTSFIPFSWELGQDWGGLEAALAIQIQDAKDQLEATKFALGAGHGSNEPTGILVGAGTVIATSNGTTGTGFALSDVYLVENALPARYVPNAAWVSSIGVFQKVRQFGTSLGPQAWADSLIVGNPPTLLGYPAYKCSTIGTSISAGYVAGAIWGVFGDWSRYKIIDRIGMYTRVIPDLFGGTAGIHFPTGQSGLVAFWRNSAGVLDSNAFRVGTISKGVN